MLIPLHTEIPARRRPIATQAIIAINVIVFLLGLLGERFGFFESRTAPAEWGNFNPQAFKLWQLVTYQFLHDPFGALHLLFNMLFLWVFGSAVENRLGHVVFAAFYLTAGAAAGIVHMFVSGSPVIGASGCVAAVSGAFLALFPRAHVRVLLWFFIIGVYSIPALWFIGFYFLIDLLNQTMDLLGRRGSDVAYAAHLGGYVFGFGVAMALLAAGLVPRGEFDMIRLWQQARRRAKFRALTQHQVGGMFESASADTSLQLASARQKSSRADEASASAQDVATAPLRADVTRHLAAHDLPAAAASYRAMLRLDAGSTLPEPQQLDLASQLYSEGDMASAARAYENLVERYPRSAQIDEVRLMLGLIYSRHVRKPDRARDLIRAARTSLRDASQRSLADQLLAELGA